MEKSRQNKFNVASRNQPQPLLPQGNKQIHNLSPDSGSCSNGVADKDSFSFKFGWKSSKQLSGTPIKKLLADEMSGETESKRTSPGVIARLMGLDALPFQQSVNKHHKGSSENRSRGTSYDGGRSSRRSSKDQQEFKDVFEVSEIPKVMSNRYSVQGAVDMKITDAEMSFIEQKFMDAKRLSNFQDLQSSKDFCDTLEVLDSNKDLLLKYFKQPDSMFKKHVDDLQSPPFESNSGHVEAIKLSDIEKYEDDFSWKSEREERRLSYHRPHYEHCNGYPSHMDRRNAMHSSPKSSKLQFKERDIKDAVPTKIVVLKPNLGKVQNGTRIVSSLCSSHTFPAQCRNETEFPHVRFRDTEQYQMKILHDTARHSRPNSLESREIAKEITRQMKISLNNGCMISSSKFKGYAGDHSSCSASGNESPDESVETHATWGTSVDLNSHSRRSSRSSESSVSREAKKRLSERWKVAHKSQEVQTINRSSTLAEMLANPEKEVKAASSGSMAIGESSRSKFACNGKPAGWVEPLGISSKDGWRDGYTESLPRSKSLPASSTAFRSPRTILHNEALRDERFMIPMEAFKQERKRAAKSRDQRHGMNTGSTKSGHNKSWSLHSSNLEGNEFSPDLDTIQNKMKINLEEDSPKLEVLVTKSLDNTLRDTIVVTDDVVDVATNENAVGSSESEPSSEKVLSELSSCVMIKADTSAVDKDNSKQQELSAESSCCKDADQPSPVSVLEPSFTDDLPSCSDCFGSLSADLQGLRMQLQLLKLESEEYVDGHMLVSSDEDCAVTSEDNGSCRTEDSWETSYIIDALSVSGIDGAQPILNSLECPVNLSVFDELEKKYSDWTTCSRSERRLLFDRINSGIVTIHKQSMNAQPWMSPSTKNISSELIENRLQDGLHRLLRNQGNVKDDTMGKVLVMESQWLDLKDDFDVIGMEIEILLLDDLVAEIASM
ncbi:PREDICTED: uncharacterized protein LOC109343315 isoform X1 [Lupinus angustifolius]|uniref:uncharacterized protein LOC109343315 isoform X1 n=1 Tax=Lupinus angustifolius TaxID=3871 RepID=UPI00092E3132|nr:PREDICTED: uncharacterized protein LOC109343315 isoform X1 [Lupinus angustifolius]